MPSELAHPFGFRAFRALLLSTAVLACTTTSSPGESSDAGMDTAGTTDAALGVDAGPTADPGACGWPAYRGLSWEATGALRSQPSYDGWAVVERSTADELVLSIPQPDLNAAQSHCTFGAQGSLPVVQIGARFWLHVVQYIHTTLPIPPGKGRELLLRVSEDGDLLLADLSGVRPSDWGDRAGISFGAPEELCKKPAVCVTDGYEHAYSMQVKADVPVRLAEGERATVQLGGAAYDVQLHAARQTTGTNVRSNCYDYVADESLRVSAEIRAIAPDAVLAQLSRGQLPTCVLGNDPGKWLVHSLYDPTARGVVNLAVTYQGVVNGEHQFQFVDDPGVFAIAEDAPMAKPVLGQTFWLAANAFRFVLRESQTGPLVLAGGSLDGEGDHARADEVAQFAEWLMLPFALEATCTYESDGTSAVSYLFQARIGSAGTVITSGNKRRIEIDGRSYDVWLSTVQGFIPIVIARAP